MQGAFEILSSGLAGKCQWSDPVGRSALSGPRSHLLVWINGLAVLGHVTLGRHRGVGVAYGGRKKVVSFAILDARNVI